MCEPISIIAAGTAAAGSLFQGYSALQQGRYESEIAKQNADMEIERARDSVTRGQGERLDYWRQIGRVKGQQAASMSANGIEADYGAGARLTSDTQMLADEDAKDLYGNIEERTRGFQVNSQNFVSEAMAARQRGKTAMVGSVFEAASSLMGGFQQQQAIRARQGKPTLGKTGDGASPAARSRMPGVYQGIYF